MLNIKELNNRLNEKIPTRMKVLYPEKSRNLQNTILNYILHKCNLINKKFENDNLKNTDGSSFTFYLTKYRFYPLFEVFISIKYDEYFDLYDISVYTFQDAYSEYLYSYNLEKGDL